MAQYLRKQPIWGAKWLFVVFISEDDPAGVVFFDPECSCWDSPEFDPEVQAVHVASAPWVMLGLEQAVIENAALQVDEKNPEVRMILNPVTDERRRVVGVAGVILDREYFRDKLLPLAIEASLPDFEGGTGYVDLRINVHDESGKLVYSSARGDQGAVEIVNEPAATRPFSFVFQDWAVGLESLNLSPQEWARSNLMLNLSLSALLGVVLLGGAVFTLRTAAREVRLSQMKSDFVSNVSHELRTPLASIRAFGEFLRLRRVPDLDKAAEYGEYIETESRRLTQLINNILDFSKIESGQKTYRFEVVDLQEILKVVLHTFEVRLQQSGFKIDFESSDEEPVRVNGDAAAILQALSNLLDNAVKYSGDRKDIVVRLERTAGIALISVRDFGMGMSRQEQRKIFDRFHRVGSSLVHNVRGSGLGLSIVHHIVKAHAGQVSVASEPKQGSTFFVRLPLAKGS